MNAGQLAEACLLLAPGEAFAAHFWDVESGMIGLDVRPQLAEIDALAEARLRYDTALHHAVQALRADGCSWFDIAQACNVRIADAQAVLAQGSG